MYMCIEIFKDVMITELVIQNIVVNEFCYQHYLKDLKIYITCKYYRVHALLLYGNQCIGCNVQVFCQSSTVINDRIKLVVKEVGCVDMVLCDHLIVEKAIMYNTKMTFTIQEHLHIAHASMPRETLW